MSSADSLRLRLDVPRQAPTGAPVSIRFTVDNVTDRTLDLHLRGREIAFDVIVEDRDGTTVWRRLEDEIIPAILRLESLGPDDALTLETTWDQRSNTGEAVPPGEYRVRAELLTEGDPLPSPTASLRVG